MSADMYRTTVEVGALLRRQFRAQLDYADIKFTEHRGFLESTFVIRDMTELQVSTLSRVVAGYGEQR